MFRLFSVLMLVVVLLFSGCSSNSVALEDESANGNMHASVPVTTVADIDKLLSIMGIVKFMEPVPTNQTTTAVYYDYNADDIESLTVVYRPAVVKGDFEYKAVSVVSRTTVDFLNRNVDQTHANFFWCRGTASEYVASYYFGRGADAEYIEEHNGITYYITEWLNRNGEFDGYGVSWAQYGQMFAASFRGYDYDDIFDFCYAVPITGWELDGDAVSLTAQDVEYLNIYDTDNSEIIDDGETLYNADGEVVGYKWLIDEAANRYQYALMPGAYTFCGKGGPNVELVTRRFTGGECVNEFTYEAYEYDMLQSDFTLDISSAGSDTDLVTDLYDNNLKRPGQTRPPMTWPPTPGIPTQTPPINYVPGN